MTVYWFKPKRYGYGAIPVTWQGWIATLGALAVCLLAALAVRTMEPKSFWSLAVLLAIYAAAVGTLFVVSYHKTGGEWRWRRGPDRSGEED